MRETYAWIIDMQWGIKLAKAPEGGQNGMAGLRANGYPDRAEFVP
jgi:hypothetical protein